MTRPVPLPAIASLPRYVPGARGAQAGPPPIKVSSNETPLPPLPSVVEALRSAAGTVNRYPDMGVSELTQRLAAAVGVGEDRVVVGGGSVAVLGHILQAYAGPGHEVVFPWRSFEGYPILVPSVGATAVPVPLDEDSRHQLDAMVDAITERTRVVVVCSPNNPTGPAVHTEEFVRFMERVPTHVLVVLDEAYLEFVTDPLAVRGAQEWGRWDNLVVVRTFSKAYGLAGLRVGYAVGPADLMAPVRACVTPFSVSTMAQVGALASLDAEPELLARCDQIVRERGRVLARVREQGWEVPDAQGNFFWLPLAERTAQFTQFCAAQDPAILVRPFAAEGVRISIGSVAENDAVLKALATFGP